MTEGDDWMSQNMKDYEVVIGVSVNIDIYSL